MSDEVCPDCKNPVKSHAMYRDGRCPVVRFPAIGLFVCACGHSKASHRPHGGRRVPLSAWICRKEGCECQEYGAEGVTVELG